MTVTVEIDANPDLVYGLITDLPTLASLAEEVVAMQLRKGDDVRKGAVFVGRNENGGRRWDHDVHRYRRRSPVGFSLSMYGPALFRFHAGNMASSLPNTAVGLRRAPGTGGPAGSAQLPGWPPASRIGRA
ncbi:hypothetical protein MRGA423_17225 [Mycobacterium tuberculosis RGTB423]|nr:hypothetical protein MRGA423_17225 [Mycobacterium tuberculosis RGTB423]